MKSGLFPAMWSKNEPEEISKNQFAFDKANAVYQVEFQEHCEAPFAKSETLNSDK